METQRFNIGNMDCPGCAREVENAVGKLDDVQLAQVDFFSNSMQLVGNVDFKQLQAQVEALGKTITPGIETVNDDLDAARRAGVLGFWDYLRTKPDSRLAIIGGVLLLIAIAIDLLQLLPSAVSSLVYVLAMLVAMKPIALSGVTALRSRREFNINLLMTVAAIGALILGEYLEAATVIFLFAIGEALEGYTTDRARDSLRSLVALKPPTAHRIADDRTEVVPVEQLRISDRIRVLPGERIPMDGAVETGHSAVDQAHITGESIPVAKVQGDEVFAGLDQWRGSDRGSCQPPVSGQYAQSDYQFAANRSVASGAKPTLGRSVRQCIYADGDLGRAGGRCDSAGISWGQFLGYRRRTWMAVSGRWRCW